MYVTTVPVADRLIAELQAERGHIGTTAEFVLLERVADLEDEVADLSVDPGLA